MIDIIIATVLTIIIYVFSLFVTINDSVLEALINLIPIIIPTFFMWRLIPRNYLKLMGFKNINIKYQIDIKIDNCFLSQSYFKEVRDKILELDHQGKGRILNENLGDIIRTTVLDINTAIVELQYFIDNDTLILKSASNIKYKLFFQLAKDFLKQVISIFTENEGISYNKGDLKARIRIEFIDKDKAYSKTDGRNPFWNKLFAGFNCKIVDFKYTTDNGNKVLISNDIIEFVGSDLESISKDIKKELTILSFKN